MISIQLLIGVYEVGKTFLTKSVLQEYADTFVSTVIEDIDDDEFKMLVSVDKYLRIACNRYASDDDEDTDYENS